jgi:serine/threonine protein phosphatase PrpC
MFFNAQWLTHKGRVTDDNQDYCGVALRKDAALYLVVDGSSQSSQSGELAHVFIRKIADRFVKQPFLTDAHHVALVINELATNLKGIYPAGRLSFLVLLHFDNDKIFTLHAGDCRLGLMLGNQCIEWLSRPHTSANAIDEIEDVVLAKLDERHILTRSFRTGRQCEIEINQYDINKGQKFLIATDGYWAELELSQQLKFREDCSAFSSSHSDDVSCLFLPFVDGDRSFQGNENFYLAKA